MGGSHPFATPLVGQVTAITTVEGYGNYAYPRGSVERKQSVVFWIKAWQSLGGQSAGSSGALKYLLKQVEELASSRDQQPVYIQWTATADGTALYNASELHDGWYIIEGFQANYQRNVVMGICEANMTVTEVSPGAPARHAMGYTGGALSTTFSGTALNLLSLPVGATAMEANFNRTGGEGAIPCILSPAASPEPVLLSTTIANYWKGGVHVYDTINTGSNAVPTSGFVNTNWVEVFFTDHNFTGDCVITNGLQLLLFQATAANICLAYLWNTALAVANWQQYGTLLYESNASQIATMRGYSLIRVGQGESAIVCDLSTAANQVGRVQVRLQRGRYEARIDLQPRTQTATNINTLAMTIVAPPKIAYDSLGIIDNLTDVTQPEPAVPADYGYGAAFVANASQPFICGFLYQSSAGTSQPNANLGSSTTIGHGDSTSLAIGATRSYAFFAIPYGVSGSYSTATLQVEAESGTLGTGWSSVADAAQSAGNVAKCASGTLGGNADLWGTAFVPDPGVYDLWVRMKVTSAASATPQMQVGLWNSDTSAYVASTTYAPNQLTTGYLWYRVAASVTPTATKNMRVRAVTTATLGTDWFMDESALVPHTLTTDNRGPQDLYQQFAYDRSVRMIRV